MNRDELINLLKLHKENLAKRDLKLLEIKRLRREIERIESDYNISITSSFEIGGKSNQISSKVENKVIKDNDKINILLNQIKILEEEVVELNDILSQVDIRLGSLNRLENEIIKAYYIDELDFQTIGLEVYYKVKQQTRSEDTIKRVIEKILDKMAKI